MAAGGKGGSKMQVTDYRLSVHFGVAATADAITGLYIDDKTAWEGEQDAQGDISINQPNLFGGPKQGGGAVGTLHWLPGGPTQVLPDTLAKRLDPSLTGATCPAFRTLASFFLTGASGQGFLWSTNNPMVAQKIRARVRRTPKTAALDQTVARIPTVQDTGFTAGIGATITDAAQHLANSINASSLDYTATASGVTVTIGTRRTGITVSGTVNCPNPSNPGHNNFDIVGAVVTMNALPRTGDTLTIDPDVYTFVSASGGDANGAHIIYEVLTNTSWGMGASPDLIDTDAFDYAASVLFGEGLGLSMLWDKQSTIEDFVNDVLSHIVGVCYISPDTGLFTLKLIRADYDVSTLPVFDQDNADMSNFQRKGWGQTINEIVVSWTNPATEQTETVTQQDIANISNQGGPPVSDSRDFHGVRNVTLASKLAERDLRAVSSPLYSMEMTVDRSAWDRSPGDVVVVNWPEEDVVQGVLRVGNIDYGKMDDSKITVALLQDIFSLDRRAPTIAPPTQWVDPSIAPPTLTVQQVSTIPAYFAASASLQAVPVALTYPEVLGMVFAYSADRDVLGYDLYADQVDATGASVFADAGSKTIVERATITTALAVEAVSTIPVSLVVAADRGPQVGGFVFIGAGDDAQEVALVDSTDGTTWTLKRGVLDTVPQAWSIGTPLWFVNPGARIVEDKTIRSAGETVEYKLASRTSQGILDPADAAEIDTTLTARPHLPLRPGNVKVNGTAFGSLTIGGATTLAITWATRNRTLEDGQVVLWTDGPVTPEYGQATVVTVRDPGGAVIYQQDGLWTENELDLLVSDFDHYPSITITVTSTKGGLDSLQGHSIQVTGLANNGSAPLPPAAPAVTEIPSPVVAPGASAFTVTAVTITGPAGEQTPIIHIAGVSDNADALNLAVRYRKDVDSTWTDHPLIPLINFSGANLTGLVATTDYDVELAYQGTFGTDGPILSQWRSYGPLTLGQFISSDTTNVGGTTAATVLANVATTLAGIAALTLTYGSTASAAASAALAAASQSAAATAASNAATDATNAATSATTAGTSASNASTSAANAATSATTASTAATTATTQATNAGTSASTASGAATTATTKATAAASSATAAAASATTASTQAGNASTSAGAASSSAATASSAATTATTQATAAAGSASTASTAASNASTSATGAASSATTATTQATNAASSATSAATQATSAAASAATAASSATLAANVGSNALNLNPMFGAWVTGHTYPDSWAAWNGSSGAFTKVSGPVSSNAVQEIVPASTTNHGFNQLVSTVKGGGWLVIEADITLGAGALTGAGVLVNLFDSGETHSTTAQVSFSQDPDNTNAGALGAGTVGKRYLFAKLVQMTPSGFTVDHLTIYAEGQSASFPANAATKTITWNRVGVRAATDAEILANTANATANTAAASIVTNLAAQATLNSSFASSVTTLTASIASNTASITTQATAITDLNGNVFGTYGFTVNANGALASMVAYAGTGPTTTSGVVFDADALVIKSSSHPNVQPFVFNAITGVFETPHLSVTGDINVKSATSGQRVEITTSCIKVYDSSGTLRVELGIF